MAYIKIQTSNSSYSYLVTNAAPAKPYLQIVSGAATSFLPLVTKTSTHAGVKLQVVSGTSSYRNMFQDNKSSGTTWNTTTNAANTKLSSTTALTKATTTGTKWATGTSTTGTKWATGTSTTGTKWATGTSTTKTVYVTTTSNSTFSVSGFSRLANGNISAYSKKATYTTNSTLTRGSIVEYSANAYSQMFVTTADLINNSARLYTNGPYAMYGNGAQTYVATKNGSFQMGAQTKVTGTTYWNNGQVATVTIKSDKQRSDFPGVSTTVSTMTDYRTIFVNSTKMSFNLVGYTTEPGTQSRYFLSRALVAGTFKGTSAPVQASTTYIKTTNTLYSTKTVTSTPITYNTKTVTSTPITYNTKTVTSTPITYNTKTVTSTPITYNTKTVTSTPITYNTTKMTTGYSGKVSSGSSWTIWG